LGPPRTPDSEEPGSRRPKLDPLSLAALTAVSLAIAIFATLVILKVFGSEDDSNAVDVTDAIESDEGSSGSFEVGEPAPDVTFEILGGGEGSIADYGGTPLVVNFWSSTCAPCLAEMPDFESVHSELDGAVAFLGVDVTDTEQAGLDMVEQTGVTYPNARDPRAEVLGAFGGISLPRTVLVSADGIVIDTHNGQMSAEELREALEDGGLT